MTRSRGRAQVPVEHSRLTTLSSAARMKEYRAGSLASLVRALERDALRPGAKMVQAEEEVAKGEGGKDGPVAD